MEEERGLFHCFFFLDSHNKKWPRVAFLCGGQWVDVT